MGYKYLVKEVNICTEYEMEMFHKLLIKGGKVQIEGLSERILQCKFLGFCYEETNEIIGISSLKRPQKSYVEKIIKKANLHRKYTDLQFELGYSFTEIKHRRKGVNRNLKSLLLNAIKEEDCLVFSTTAIASSQSFLENNDFICYGNSYEGKNDNNIQYYERRFGKVSDS